MRIIFFLVITIFLSISAMGQNADINLLRDINVHRNTSLDKSFTWITYSDAPISIAAPVLIFGAGYFLKDDNIKYKGLYIAASLAMATVVASGLKYSVNRTRPYVTYPDIEQVIPVTSPSFPSGHTSIAFSTATSLSITFPKWYVIAPSYLWASAVAYSRMHLGEHYPTDVLAGMIIGAGSAYLCYRLQKLIMQKNEKKAKDIIISE